MSLLNRMPPDYGEFPTFSFLHCNVTLNPTTNMSPLNSHLPTAAGWTHTDTLGLWGLSRPGATRCGGRSPAGAWLCYGTSGTCPLCLLFLSVECKHSRENK